MAQIPQYESQKKIETQVGRPAITTPNVRVDPAVFARQGEMMEALGQTVQDVTDRLEKIRDLQQATAASSLVMDRTNALQMQMQNDPEIWTAKGRANEELKKIGNDASKLIDSPIAKQKFQFDYESQSLISQAKINKGLNKRAIDLTTDTINENIIKKGEAFVTGSPAEQQVILAEVDNMLNTLVAFGAYTPEEKLLEFSRLKTEMNESAANHLTYNVPEATLFLLDSKDKGVFKHLDTDTRLQHEKDAKALIAKRETIGETLRGLATDENEDNMVLKLLENNLTVQEVVTGAQNGDIRPKFAKTLKNALLSKKTLNPKTDLRVYDEIMTMITKSADDPEKKIITDTQIRERIFEETAIGNLTPADYKSLYYTNKGGRETTISEGYIAEQNGEPPNYLAMVWKQIDRFNMYNPVSVGKLMNSVVDRVIQENAKGEQVNQIAREEIRKENVFNNPAVANYNKEGQLMVDANGNKAIVYPDGRIKEVE